MNKYLNKEFLLTNKAFIIKVTVIILMIAVAFVVFVLNSNGDSSEFMVSEGETITSAATEQMETDPPAETMIFVDISGAVKEPRLAELPQGSRVADAIEAAGGLKKDADIEAINRAAFLTDGEKIIIPEEGEMDAIPDAVKEQMPTGNNTGSKINLNNATAEDLQTLDGVGPVTAEKIIEYREKNGRFAKTEELKNIDGIGDKTYEKMKENIVV